ncbi:MAG TPA: hypothetical protein P5257_07255 [Bacteroidales bacterium]|nr:hypothetical protein [Bacteroidales bacterium]
MNLVQLVMNSYVIKKAWFYCLLIFFAITIGRIEGQEQQEINIRYPEQYLFPDFQPARVAMKAGKDVNILLNYSVVLEKMMFLQRGQVYEMMNSEAVDTVYLQNRKFIPYGRIFLEVALEGDITLCIQHTGKDLGPSSPAAYGGKSDVSSSNYINYMGLTGEPFRMQHMEELNLKYDRIYWLKSDDKWHSFTSKGQLMKIYPDRKSQIRKYFRNNKVDFSDSQEVIKLLKNVLTAA